MDDAVDLAELAAVCGAVLACYDQILKNQPPAPTGPAGAAASTPSARVTAGPADPGIPGQVWWALDLVGRGAAGSTPAELALAIEVLQAVAAGRAPAKRDVARL
jgi:hypothetical protein